MSKDKKPTYPMIVSQFSIKSGDVDLHLKAKLAAAGNPYTIEQLTGVEPAESNADVIDNTPSASAP